MLQFGMSTIFLRQKTRQYTGYQGQTKERIGYRCRVGIIVSRSVFSIDFVPYSDGIMMLQIKCKSIITSICEIYAGTADKYKL